MDCQLHGRLEVDDRSGSAGGPSGRWLDAIERVQGWLLPPRCVLCLDPGRPPTLDLCPACEADLPRLDPGAGACLPGVKSQTVAFAPFRYDWPVDALVRGFKYHGRLAHGRVLGTLLAEALLESPVAEPDLLVPVPLHPARERERGFNQAWELARVVARRLRVPADATLCTRTRATPPQAKLDATARRANLADAFDVVRTPGVAHVAIVDDVLTTGATAAALARALLDCGVQRVDVWTVARA